MLEKNIFKKYRFNSKYNIIGDFDFFIKISQKYKFGCIQSPLASYRVHDSNLSGKKIRAFECLTPLIKQFGFILNDLKFLFLEIYLD